MTKESSKKQAGPRVDEFGRSPLHYAAGEGDSGKVRDLLQAKADPNAQDQDGWTALHFAAQSGSVTCTRALLAAGARVDLRDGHGNTPLFRAVFNYKGSGALIVMLRDAGADPRAVNSHGVSPAKLARTITNQDVLRYFSDIEDAPT